LIKSKLSREEIIAAMHELEIAISKETVSNKRAPLLGKLGKLRNML
jgi:hypothetical protein